MLMPAFLVLSGLFLLPLGYFFLQSFWRIRFYMLQRHFTLYNYRVAVEQYFGSWIFTLEIAALIATVTTICAFLLAYYARFRAGRYEGLVLFITLTTLFGGYLVKVYAWKTILGLEGVLNLAMLAIGLIRHPITGMLYSPFAVVVTLVNFLIPFAVLPIYASIRTIDERTLEAARDLGASPFRVLCDVLIPQASTGIIAAFTLAFLLAAGDYVTPQLVGGPRSVMVGYFIETAFVDRLNAPLGAALTFAVLGSCLLVVAGVSAGLRRVGRQP
jgi:spermidine/putrescine transport system permease protein